MKVFFVDTAFGSNKDGLIKELSIEAYDNLNYLAINNPEDSNSIYIINSVQVKCNKSMKKAIVTISDENRYNIVSEKVNNLDIGCGFSKDYEKNELIVFTCSFDELLHGSLLSDKTIMILPGGNISINFKEIFNKIEVILEIHKENIEY